MIFSKTKVSNVLLVVIILLFIIPATRKPIQVFIHKGFAKVSPSSIKKSNQEILTNYNWKLEDNASRLFDFQDAKGRVVFINFWATWCPPCIAEMSSINDLYKEYKQEVVFLLITNEDKKTIADFMSKNRYEFNFHHPLTDTPKLLNNTSIPQTYVIDKTGHIVIDKNGAANWNSKSVKSQINELLRSN